MKKNPELSGIDFDASAFLFPLYYILQSPHDTPKPTSLIICGLCAHNQILSFGFNSEDLLSNLISSTSCRLTASVSGAGHADYLHWRRLHALLVLNGNWSDSHVWSYVVRVEQTSMQHQCLLLCILIRDSAEERDEEHRSTSPCSEHGACDRVKGS